MRTRDRATANAPSSTLGRLSMSASGPSATLRAATVPHDVSGGNQRSPSRFSPLAKL